MSNADAERSSIWTISNVITITRILLVPVFVAALLCPWPEWFGIGAANEGWKRIVAAGVFVLISCTDWLDGYLARRLGQVTDFGKFMDPLADKILVAAALISLVELGALPTWVVLIILAREFIVSGVRMMAATKGVVIAASWLGKFKTVFQMIAIVLFTVKESHADIPFSQAITDPLWVVSWLVMIVAVVLTIASLIDYLFKARDVIGLGSAAVKEALAGEESVIEREYAVEIRESDLEKRARLVVESLLEKEKTLAVAESLTGGMIGSCITSVSGSSAVFKGGIISYVNEVKHERLGVDEEVLEADGAVSERCACQMAQGARREIGSDIAVAVTGIAGPGGAEPGKPVGTVWMAVSTEQSTAARRFLFDGTREEVRAQTVTCALDAILQDLKSENVAE